MKLQLLKRLFLILLAASVAGGPFAQAAVGSDHIGGPAAAALESSQRGSEKAVCGECPKICPCVMPCGQGFALLPADATPDFTVPALGKPNSCGLLDGRRITAQRARAPPPILFQL